MFSLSVRTWVLGAVYGGGGVEEVIAVRFTGRGDQSVLSSMQIMSSVCIGVDVTAMCTVVVGDVFLRIGESGTGRCVVSSLSFCGLGTCILIARELVL